MDSLRIVSTDTVDTIPPPEPEGIASSDQENFRTKVFPNPIGNQSIISIESPVQGYATISVVDINGRVLTQFNHLLRNGMNRIDSPFISSDALSAGIYTILFKSESYSSRTKFVSTGQ